MQDPTNEDIMVQGVTDEEKSFDSSDFGLDKRLLKAIKSMGYTHPTLVQAQVIPLVLAGKDTLVKARTGSGKTVAYAIPAIQKLLSITTSTNGIKVVVLVPSKELCIQTYNCFKALTRYCSNVVNCIGLYDMNVEQQKGQLNEFTDVVISTPKILLSHLKNQSDNLLKNISTFIIDEADILLSYGYEADVSKIIELIPATCQNMVLSATLNDDVSLLKQKLLHNCVTIKLKEENSNLNEFYIEVNDDKKPLLLYSLLRLHILKGKVIIFVNSLELGYYLYILLTRFSMKAIVLNNELPALSRNNIIYQFNRGMYDYLIATDEGLIQSKEDEEKKDTEEDTALLDDDDDDDKNDDDEEGMSLSEGEEEGMSLSDDKELIASEDDDDLNLSDDDDEEIPELEEIQSEEEEEKELDNGHFADEFNASRGIDFENVSAVVNYSMPSSVSNYIHRIGRTARAQNLGTALSFIDLQNKQEIQTLQDIQKYNPPRNGKPSPQCLPFDIKQIESFSYRVEDVRRSITKNLIKETRIMELRKEILNSNKLKLHFEDNPQELRVLQHAAAKKLIKPVAYLKDIPDYLVPDALKAKVSVKDETRKEQKGEWKRRKIDDPLRSFAVTAELLDNHEAMRNGKGKYQVSNNIRIPMSGHARWEQRNKKLLRRKRMNKKH